MKKYFDTNVIDIYEDNTKELEEKAIEDGNYEFTKEFSVTDEQIINLINVNETIENENFELFITEDDIKFTRNLTEEEMIENNNRFKEIWIGTKKFVIEIASMLKQEKEIEEKTNVNKKHIRTYNKEVSKIKVKYGKAYTEKSFTSTLIKMAIACSCCGFVMGLMANSYRVANPKKNLSISSCAFGWLLQEEMDYTLTPFYSDIFWGCFFIGFGILAVICLFIYLESENKKNSRVGHEHGNARLGNSRDFKTYKRKFME